MQWNSAEQTWDCPCHGSRFDALGHVIDGPANSDLAATGQQGSRPVSAGSAGKERSKATRPSV